MLQAMGRTDAEQADDREEQEVRNAEVTNVRHFLGSIMTSISDFLIVADRAGKIEEASASFRSLLGLDANDPAHWQLCDFFEGEAWDRSNGTVGRVISMRREQTVNVDLKTSGGPDPVEFRISPRLDRRRKCTWVVMTGRTKGELLRAYAELEASHRKSKDAQGQLVRNEKTASLGPLLAGVMHELNNSISFVFANAHTQDKCANRLEACFDQVLSGANRVELVTLRVELCLDRRLKNLRNACRITVPTLGSFGPRDRAGVAGPVEAALVGAEVQEGEDSPLSVPGIASSFDPGMVCGVQ